jgi:hypothetical protein
MQKLQRSSNVDFLRVINRIPIPHDGEHLPPIINGTVRIGVVILQSTEFKGDLALEEVAARRSTLARIVASNAVMDGVDPLQDALNALAGSDRSLVHIDLGGNDAYHLC